MKEKKFLYTCVFILFIIMIVSLTTLIVTNDDSSFKTTKNFKNTCCYPTLCTGEVPEECYCHYNMYGCEQSDSNKKEYTFEELIVD